MLSSVCWEADSKPHKRVTDRLLPFSLCTGYAIQRNILAQLGRNDSNKDSIMWDRKQLLNSTYEEGRTPTKVLGSIEIVDAHR